MTISSELYRKRLLLQYKADKIHQTPWTFNKLVRTDPGWTPTNRHRVLITDITYVFRQLDHAKTWQEAMIAIARKVDVPLRNQETEEECPSWIAMTRATAIIIAVDDIEKNDARLFVGTQRRPETGDEGIEDPEPAATVELPRPFPSERLVDPTVNLSELYASPFPYANAPGPQPSIKAYGSIEWRRHFLYPMIEFWFLNLWACAIPRANRIMHGFRDDGSAQVVDPDQVGPWRPLKETGNPTNRACVEGDNKTMAWSLWLLPYENCDVFTIFNDGDMISMSLLHLDWIRNTNPKFYALLESRKSKWVWIYGRQTAIDVYSVFDLYSSMTKILPLTPWPGLVLAAMINLVGSDYQVLGVSLGYPLALTRIIQQGNLEELIGIKFVPKDPEFPTYTRFTIRMDVPRWEVLMDGTAYRAPIKNKLTRLKNTRFSLTYLLAEAREELISPEMLRLDSKGRSVYGFVRSTDGNIVAELYE